MTTRLLQARLCVAVALAVLLGASCRVTAQTPALVADVNAVTVSPPSWPSELARFGNVVLFAATTTATGRELFVTQGLHEAPQTTRLLVDINPGAGSSTPQLLTTVGGNVFFSAEDGVHGAELWISDGTAAGTRMVKDILPGAAGSNPGSLVQLGGTLLFRADDGQSGSELWKSDGTAAGTQLVKDIWPGAASSTPEDLVAAGPTLFFGADDGAAGPELWRSDGTAAGTWLVKDIRPGLGSFGGHLVAVGASVMFQAITDASGQELWRSDGTAAGTMLVADIQPGPSSSFPVHMTLIGNTVFFTAYWSELWRTDGTALGTSRVLANVGNTLAKAAFGSAFVFVAQTGSGDALWLSDGTPAGTFTLAGPTPAVTMTQLRVIGSTIWFQVNAASWKENQGSLWKSDGTVAGTGLVTRIRPGTGVDGGPTGFTGAANGRVVFAADDGVHGNEPWVTDGTAAGTKMLADLELSTTRTHSSRLREIVDLFGTTLLVADDGLHGLELWRSDGTAAGTQLVLDINPGKPDSGARGLTRVGPLVFFSADDGTHGTELWVTDGTAAGTRMVLDVVPGPSASWPESLTPFHGVLYCAAAGGLWRSDGTAAGTTLVANVPVGDMFAFGDRLLFAGTDNLRGTELWSSDGTGPGTALLVDIDPVVTVRGPLSSTPHELVEWNGIVYFTAETSQYGGRDLWKTDGTAAGTVLVADVDPGLPSIPVDLRPAGSRLMFSAGPLFTGFRYLWTSDGTTAGTMRVTTRAIDPGPLCPLGSRVLFSARDPQDRELWSSDGTDAGTQRIKDLRPTGSGDPAYLTPIGSRFVWFQADDGTSGGEPWVTDGTAAGTRRVADVAPGAATSYAMLFRLSAGWLWFAADDGTKGIEPWKLFPSATAQAVGDGCHPSGRAPTLSADDPVLGTSVGIGGDFAPAGAPGAVQLGAVPAQPLTWIRGCTLYLDPFLMVSLPGFLPAGPRWSQQHAVASNPSLTGVRVVLQGAFLLLGPVPDVALTNGVYWTLGS